MNAKREMKELKCELSDEELLDRARTGAQAGEELVRLAAAKADWMTAHKEQVQAQAGTVSRMQKCLRTGQEFRLVECTVEFHTPVQGIKRTTRLDTGEVVSEDRMTPNEAQENLFEPPANPAGLHVVKPAELPLETPAEESVVATGESYASDGQDEG